MDGATRRLQLGDAADTPAKRVKTESGAPAAVKPEGDGSEASAGNGAAETGDGEGIKAADTASFWAGLGGGAGKGEVISCLSQGPVNCSHVRLSGGRGTQIQDKYVPGCVLYPKVTQPLRMPMLLVECGVLSDNAAHVRDQ